MTLDALIKLLARRVQAAGSQGEWAKQHGVAPSLVSAVLRRERAPSQSVLDALGLEREEQRYRRKRDE
jgi:hypothetical protein